MRERWRAVSHEMRLMIQRNMHMKPRLRNPRHFDRCLGQLVRSGQKPNIFAWQHLLCPSWRMFDRCYNNLANKPGRKDSNTWLRWISNSRWSHRNDGSEPTLWKIHGANKDTELRYAIVVTWSSPDCDRTKLKFDFSDDDDSERLFSLQTHCFICIMISCRVGTDIFFNFAAAKHLFRPQPTVGTYGFGSRTSCWIVACCSSAYKNSLRLICRTCR